MKPQIFDVAGVVIPHDGNGTFFLQRKDTGLPNIFGQEEAICSPGGGWTGIEALEDLTPFGTLTRELSAEEMKDKAAAEYILAMAKPWKAFLAHTATEVFDLRQGNTRKGYTTLLHVYEATCDLQFFDHLRHLELRYGGNLLLEGFSHIVSADEHAASKRGGAYGHDQIVRRFASERGWNSDFYCYPNPPITEVAWLTDYESVMAEYQVTNTPYNIVGLP